MGLFRRWERQWARSGPAEAAQPTDPRAPAPPPETSEVPAGITVARTLVKSEPELAELVASEPRLHADGLDVKLAEKGFGTRVEIRAAAASGLAEPDLEGLLDILAEPQKRPFTAA